MKAIVDVRDGVVPGRPEPQSPRRRGPRLPAGTASALAVVLLMAIYAVWLGDRFLNGSARLLDAHQTAPQLILALAVLAPLIAGSFDLSVASLATLSTFLVVGMRVQHDWSTGTAIALALAVGVVAGLVNGALVEFLNINAFIATLGTGSVLSGAAAVYSNGQQIGPRADTPQLSAWFSGNESFGSFTGKLPGAIGWALVIAVLCAIAIALLRRRPAAVSTVAWTVISVAVPGALIVVLLALGAASWIADLSWMLGFVMVVTLVLWVLMDATMFGRHLKATGANRAAATLAGVPARRMVMWSFVLSGLLASLAGVVIAANLGAASPDVAATQLLPAFAAAFISTVILSDGKFTVWGTVVGGVLLVWIAQGLVLGGLIFTWTQVINGAVLLIAVAVSTVRRRRA